MVRKAINKTHMSVQLPIGLLSEVDKIILQKSLGFRSRNEFCVDSVRRVVRTYQNNNSNRNYQPNGSEEKKTGISEGGEESTQTEGGTKNESLDNSGRSPEETTSDTVRLSDKQNQPQPTTTKRTPDQQRETQKEGIRRIGGEGPYGRIKENW